MVEPAAPSAAATSAAARTPPAAPAYAADPLPWLRTLPPHSRLILQGDARARAAAGAAWGVGLSEEPCRAVVQGGRATLWLGPDEHLLLDAAWQTGANSLMSLESALDGLPHALVDVSHRQIALQLSGPLAATILNGACPLDLDAKEFPVGMCTRTVFEKADIVLWRTDAEVFHVEVWRSFTGYVLGLLEEIGREFQP